MYAFIASKPYVEELQFSPRFLTWAFHVFFYDIAYEPEGWPWTPVRQEKNIKNSVKNIMSSLQIKTLGVYIKELGVMVDPTDDQFESNITDFMHIYYLFIGHLCLLLLIIMVIRHCVRILRK